MNRDTADITERAPSLDRDGRAAYRIMTDGADISTTVARAVAEVADCDLIDEEYVLYDVIDPDALEQIFDDRPDGTPRTMGRVVFELRGCRVEVHADGHHVIYGPDEEHDEASPSAAGSV